MLFPFPIKLFKLAPILKKDLIKNEYKYLESKSIETEKAKLTK
jgi:hypothetical protein